jgi:hypothetical protein
LIASLAGLAWSVASLVSSPKSTEGNPAETGFSSDDGPTPGGIPRIRFPFGTFAWPTRQEWLERHGLADSAATAEQVARFREYLVAPAMDKKRLRLACAAEFGEEGDAIRAPEQANLGCLPWRIERMISLGQASLEPDDSRWGLRAKPLSRDSRRDGKRDTVKKRSEKPGYSWTALSEKPYAVLKREVRFTSLAEARRLVRQSNPEDASCRQASARAALIVALEDLLPAQEAWMLMQTLYGGTMNCLQPTDEGYERMHQRIGLLLLERGRVQEAVVALGNALRSEPPEEEETTLFWLGFSASLNVGTAATAAQSNAFWDQLERRFPYGLHNMVARTIRGDSPLETQSRGSSLVMSVYEGDSWNAYNLWAFLSVLVHTVGDGAALAELGTYLDTGIHPRELGSSLFAIHMAQVRSDFRQPLAIGTRILSRAKWNVTRSDLLAALYPFPWAGEVAAACPTVDGALVWAVMRSESGFNPMAVSPDGAKGLMQVRRSVATGASSTRGGSDLFDVRLNLRAGCEALDGFLRSYGTGGVEALAAYNAGPLHAERWLKRYKRISQLLFLDLIPFPGTRRYVGAVMEDEIVYAERLARERPELRQGAAGGVLLQFIPSAEKMRLITFASLDLESALEALSERLKRESIE